MTDSGTKSRIPQKKKVDKVEKKVKKTKKSKENDSANEEEAGRGRLAGKKPRRSKTKAGHQVAYQQEEGSREEIKNEEGAREDDQVKDQLAKKTQQRNVQLGEGNVEEDHQTECKDQRLKRKSNTVAQDTTAAKSEKRTEKIVEIPLEWMPIRHPKLPCGASPHYFVKKDVSGVLELSWKVQAKGANKPPQAS